MRMFHLSRDFTVITELMVSGPHNQKRRRQRHYRSEWTVARWWAHERILRDLPLISSLLRQWSSDTGCQEVLLEIVAEYHKEA
jgi:hypothetical protein